MATAFGSLAPWTWMRDSELVGLHHPLTDEPLLCSILGRLRQVFALLVYRGVAGRRWILNTILDEGDSGGLEDKDSAFEQDCVKLEFVSKRELEKPDRAVLSTAGFAPPVKSRPVWPVFRSLVPGGYPWHVTQAEAELLLYAVPRVAAFATLWRDTPELEADLSGKGVPFLPAGFDPAQRSLQVGDLQWQPQVTPPETPPAPVSLPADSVQTCVALPQAPGFHLELDIFYSPMPIAGKERPYFPKAIMAVDRASGFISAFQLADEKDDDGAKLLGKALEGALLQTRHRPEAIHVQRPRVAQMLTSIAAQLSVPLQVDFELVSLNEAREEITRMLAPNPKRER